MAEHYLCCSQLGLQVACTNEALEQTGLADMKQELEEQLASFASVADA